MRRNARVGDNASRGTRSAPAPASRPLVRPQILLIGVRPSANEQARSLRMLCLRGGQTDGGNAGDPRIGEFVTFSFIDGPPQPPPKPGSPMSRATFVVGDPEVRGGDKKPPPPPQQQQQQPSQAASAAPMLRPMEPTPAERSRSGDGEGASTSSPSPVRSYSDLYKGSKGMPDVALEDAAAAAIAAASEPGSSRRDGSATASPSEEAASESSTGRGGGGEGADDGVSAALARAQRALDKAETSLDELEGLPSAREETLAAADGRSGAALLPRVLAVARSVAVVGVLSAALLASHAFGLVVQVRSVARCAIRETFLLFERIFRDRCQLQKCGLPYRSGPALCAARRRWPSTAG